MSKQFQASGPAPTVLALDLEGTLISNSVSLFVRPGLSEFLSGCQKLFPRVAIFTAVSEVRFRQIAAFLVDEGSVPLWFQRIEYIHWAGPTKDLMFVTGAEVTSVLLVDDLVQYIHPGQQAQWIPIQGFEPPFEQVDTELERVLEELKRRVEEQR
jgi:hypothetical protein